jgi:hypothetical protein
MSYTVVVVAPPVPEEDDEAWNQLDPLIDEPGLPPAVFRELHDRLTARYPCLSTLPDDRVDEAVWSDGPLWNNFGHRAAVLSFATRRAPDVMPFLIDTSTGLGLNVFDWQTNLVHRADGIQGFTLRVEEEPALQGPTLRQVSAAVDRMTPDGGPSFLALEGPGEDYVQAAGGDGLYTAEWREYAGTAFRHWVAGRPGAPVGPDVELPTNGAHVVVKENEQITREDVKSLLAAFAAGEARPARFAWRDITAIFR